MFEHEFPFETLDDTNAGAGCAAEVDCLREPTVEQSFQRLPQHPGKFSLEQRYFSRIECGMNPLSRYDV